MDSMNRKLFKSRDARNKLRDMGGIMASSPELAQTVQQFQEGGRVTGLEQMEADPIRDGRATMVNGKTFVMLPSGVVLDARTQAPASPEETLAVQRKLNAFPGRDPVLSEENLARRANPSFETDMRDRGFGIGVSDRALAAPSVMDSSSAYRGEEIGFPDVSTYRTPPNMPSPSQLPPSSAIPGFTQAPDPFLSAEDLLMSQPLKVAPSDPSSDPSSESGTVRYEGGPVNFQDWQEMSRTERKRAGLPTSEIGGQLFFDRFQVGMGGNPDQLYTSEGPFGVDEDLLMSQPVAPSDPSRISTEALMRTTQPVTVDYQGNLQTFYADMETGKLYDASGQDLNRLMSPSDYDVVQSKVNQSLRIGARQEAADLARQSQAAQEDFENFPSGETLALAAEAKKKAVPEPVPEVARDAVERVLSRPSGTFTSRDVFAEEGPNVAPERPSNTGTPLDFDPASSMPPPLALDVTGTDTPAPDTPAPDTDTGADTPAPDTGTGTDTGTDTGAGTSTPTLDVVTPEVVEKVADPEVQRRAAASTPRPDDTEDDIRAKYEARYALLKEVLGEDEEGARNKGMDLAMIGLAIMSGQSPNALTNIGQGAAAGLKAVSARDEAARERNRALRTAALEGVLEEEAAGTAAAASAAEKALDRQNRLDAAAIRNSAALDTKTGEVTYRTLFNEAYKVATDLVNMPPEVRSGEMTAVEYASKIAKAGLAGSQGRPTDGPSTTIADPAAIDAAIQSRVDAAKNNPTTLAAIKQSLITKGMDPSKYGLK